jgi:predicted phage baseplate assembly protein
MPLANLEPVLDDRTMEDIYRDLRLRIPRYNKTWTNFNDSDPGITLLQLFSWLSEMMLAQMNRIPRKNYIKFLELFGMELEPAKPATAHLTFFTKANQIADPVPERAQIAAQLPNGPPVIFETTRALGLIQAPLVVVGVLSNGALVNVTSANDAPGTSFHPLGWNGELGSALYFGFDKVEGLTPFPVEMTFRVFLPISLKPPQPQRTDAPAAQPPVSLVWEYRPRDGADWERLNVFQDESAAFLLEGYIRVQGPADIELSTETRLATDPRYWIRVRVDSGSYPNSAGPEIDFIRPNTVLAENLVTVLASILGQSEGQPSELFALPYQGVQPDTLSVSIQQDPNPPESWQLVDDFLGSGPQDTHYILNATAGTIQFGDGDYGRIPEAGSLIVANSFRYGGGPQANSASAGTITSPQTQLSGVDHVTNERPAVGGYGEQSIEQMQQLAPSILKRRNRAITKDDFIAFAMESGGVANATALENTHPDFPATKVPGAITVVIVPDTGGNPPLLSSDLIASVCKNLDTYRLITTEVYVKGADYKQIRVEAFVESNAKSAPDSVALNINNALAKLLDPKAWNFGTPLHPTEIFRTILDADRPNIAGIGNLNIYVDGRLHGDLTPIALADGELLYGSNHLIQVSPAQGG